MGNRSSLDMQLSFNIFSMTLLLGAAQGFFLALLLFERKRNQTANRMLAFLHRVRRLYTGQYVVGVTHADLLAFLWLWVLRRRVTGDNRRRLEEFGLSAPYPETASVSTFTFRSLDPEERPQYNYVCPY